MTTQEVVIETGKTVKEGVTSRPTGSTAAITSLVVLIADKAGVELTAADAAVIIGGLTSMVSLISPYVSSRLQRTKR